MARLFDVGPLPQITPPTILDTNPVVPFDLAQMGKAINDKTQLDIYKANNERQRQAMEFSFMNQFADNLRGMLKGADGKSLAPISQFHQQTYDRVTGQINDAVGKMSDLIEAGDYRGAYKTMFDTGSKIGQDKDYKRFMQETNLFNETLQAKDLDPYAVNNLYKDLQSSATPFDLSRFDRSSLAMYDEASSVEAFLKAIKPEETLQYDGYKYEVQQTPDQIRQSLQNLIKQDPKWGTYLQNRGVDPNNINQLNKYINSKLSGNLIGEMAGAEYIHQNIDGKDTIVGVKRLVSFDKSLAEAGDPSSSSSKKKGSAFAGVWDNPQAETQAILRATEETATYPAFRSAFNNAHNEYYNVKQAFDTQIGSNKILGLTSSTGDQMVDLMNTVQTLGLEQAKQNIRITKADGTVDQEAEDRLLTTLLPKAAEAFFNKERYAKGSEELLTGTYDKFKSAYEKKGLAVPFSQLGITKGAQGQVVFPEGFDLDNKEADPTVQQKMSSGVGLGNPNIDYGDTDKSAREARNYIRDLNTDIIDKQLKGRYEKYFKPEGDHLIYHQLPDETSADYEPFRTMNDLVQDLVTTDQLSFYSADESISNGLPVTMRLLTEKDRAKELDAKKAWNNVDISGTGFDAESGTFFLTGYPRVSISKDEYENYNSGRSKTKYTNVIPEEDKGNFYLKSKKGIVIPWDGFPTEFYQSFIQRHGSYQGLYSGIVGAMEEKVPDGQPVRIMIGKEPMYVTPTGQFDPSAPKTYQVTVPGPVNAEIQKQGPLPPNTTSSADPVSKNDTYIPPAPKADSTVQQQVVDDLTGLVEKYPHLGSIVPSTGAPAPGIPVGDFIATGLKNANDGVNIAKKQAAVSQDYPVSKLVVNAMMAVESGGDQSAVSPKGNVGVMQLSPAAAKEAATYIGVAYDAEKVKGDKDYNKLLGEGYYTKMLDKFKDTTLAIAAYNAGPGRVQESIEEHGDPSKGEISMTDFLKTLPAETQDYVQKVDKIQKQGAPKQGLLDGFLADAKSSLTTMYETDAKGLETLLERGTQYIGTLTTDEISTRNPLVAASLHVGLDESNPQHQNTIQSFLNRAVPGFLSDKSKVTESAAAWCAAFVNNVLSEGKFGTLNTDDKYDLLKAKSYAKIGTEVPGLDNGAKPGDVVILERSSGGHHVGFYVGKKDGRHLMLGGNQNNKVSVMPINTDTSKVLAVRRVNDVQDISPKLLDKIAGLTETDSRTTTR